MLLRILGFSVARTIETSGTLSFVGILINRCNTGRTRSRSRDERTASGIRWRSGHVALIAKQQGRLLEDRAVGEDHDGRFFGVWAGYFGDLAATLVALLATDIDSL
jgi:hypothetical protein